MTGSQIFTSPKERDIRSWGGSLLLFSLSLSLRGVRVSLSLPSVLGLSLSFRLLSFLAVRVFSIQELFALSSFLRLYLQQLLWEWNEEWRKCWTSHALAAKVFGYFTGQLAGWLDATDVHISPFRRSASFSEKLLKLTRTTKEEEDLNIDTPDYCWRYKDRDSVASLRPTEVYVWYTVVSIMLCHII